MSKPGRPSTLLDCLDESTRARLSEAVISEARGRYVEIYRTFGLAERGIQEDSFYRWARKVRRDRAKQLADDRTQSPSPSSSSSSGVALATLMRTLDYANKLLDAGDAKSLPHASTIIRASADILRLDFERAASERAAEKHEAWKAETSKALRSAVEAKSPNGETLTREDVCGLIDDIMRGKA
jgi:hypothetical protein